MGNTITDDEAFMAKEIFHFEQVFCDDEPIHLQSKLEVLSLYPRFFSDAEADLIGRPVTLDEIDAVLHGFSKDKAPELDDCPVEFHLVVFDLVGNDILSAVEYNKDRGCIPLVLNAKHIAFIPKFGKLQNFADFRPISLCKLIYKVITKVLADRMKPFLFVARFLWCMFTV